MTGAVLTYWLDISIILKRICYFVHIEQKANTSI